MTPSERSLRARIAAESMWAQTPAADRPQRTAAARQALEQKFLTEADGDPVRAAHLRRAHFARLALKSAQARRRAAELSAVAEAAETELAGSGGPDAAA